MVMQEIVDWYKCIKDDDTFNINNIGEVAFNRTGKNATYTIYKRGSGSTEQYALESFGAYLKITIIDNVLTV